MSKQKFGQIYFCEFKLGRSETKWFGTLMGYVTNKVLLKHNAKLVWRNRGDQFDLQNDWGLWI